MPEPKKTTIQEAARELGVSKSTLKRWLKDGTLKEPERIRRGKQRIRNFSSEYLKNAKKIIDSF